MNKTEYAPYEEKMSKTVASLETEYAAIRAGRANPAVLDKLTVEYYGAPTPINQIAAISVPEPRMLVIAPWDPSQLKAVEKAILASDIGITPTNDGKSIRLSFPTLTEERRRLGDTLPARLRATCTLCLCCAVCAAVLLW